MVALYTSSATLNNTTTPIYIIERCIGGNYPPGGIVIAPGASVVLDVLIAYINI